MKILLMLLTFIATTSIHALEIDEKLTLRFLKVSNSKKTILINRGAEDGVAVGDHAKFFITSGVIARGVVEKVSPSRSIWSLYRVVDPAEITDGKVLNLKIASPVKITVDPTKSMKDEEIPAGSDSMDMSGGDTESATSAVTTDEQKELDDMGIEDSEIAVKTEPKTKKSVPSLKANKELSIIEEAPIASSNTSKSWEFWGTLYLNSLSGTVDNGSAGTGTSSTAKVASGVDFSVGVEKYFFNSENFLKNTSIVLFGHKRTLESGSDIKVTSDSFEFGGGVNYHFYNSAANTRTLVGFGSINAGTGSSSNTEVVVANGASTETSVKGTNMFYSLGVGAKYVLTNGFGVRALLDYYSSSETYDFGNDVTTTSTLSGPRVLFGVSYRF